MVQQLIRAVRTEALGRDNGTNPATPGKQTEASGKNGNRKIPFENLLKERVGSALRSGPPDRTAKLEGGNVRGLLRKMRQTAAQTLEEHLPAVKPKPADKDRRAVNVKENGADRKQVKAEERKDTDLSVIGSAAKKENSGRKTETASLHVPEQMPQRRDHNRDLRLEKDGKKERGDRLASTSGSGGKNIRELVITLDDRRTSPVDRLSEGEKTGSKLQKDTLKHQGNVKGGNENFETAVKDAMAFRETESGPEGSGTLRQPPVTREAANLLDRYLKAEGGRTIARNIRFTLRDNNNGEIRLVLKPESLGNVRIRLQLTENNITGRIFVENNSVRQIFQDNIRELTRLLEDQGFSTAGLDVAVDSGDGQPGQTGQQGERNGTVPFFSERLKEIDSQIPVARAYRTQETGLLNMIV